MNEAQRREFAAHLETCAVIERSGADAEAVTPLLEAEHARFQRRMHELQGTPAAAAAAVAATPVTTVQFPPAAAADGADGAKQRP